MICKTCNGTGLKPPGTYSNRASVVCHACFGSGKGGDMQDGMLAHYLGQAGSADANVETRIEKEPFDFRDCMKNQPARR